MNYISEFIRRFRERRAINKKLKLKLTQIKCLYKIRANAISLIKEDEEKFNTTGIQEYKQRVKEWEKELKHIDSLILKVHKEA